VSGFAVFKDVELMRGTRSSIQYGNTTGRKCRRTNDEKEKENAEEAEGGGKENTTKAGEAEKRSKLAWTSAFPTNAINQNLHHRIKHQEAKQPD
jgi:hypothetical protein